MKKIIFVLLILISFNFVFSLDSIHNWKVGEGEFSCGLSGGLYNIENEIRVFATGEEVTVNGRGLNGTCFNNIGRTLALGTTLEGSDSWLFYYWNLIPTDIPDEPIGSVSRAATIGAGRVGEKEFVCSASSFGVGSHSMISENRTLSYYVDNPPLITSVETELVDKNPNYILNFFSPSKKKINCYAQGSDMDRGDKVALKFILWSVDGFGNEIKIKETEYSDYNLNAISLSVDLNVDRVLPVGSKVFCEAEIRNNLGLKSKARSYNGIGTFNIDEIISYPWVN
jgi:hypothetical protein